MGLGPEQTVFGGGGGGARGEIMAKKYLRRKCSSPLVNQNNFDFYLTQFRMSKTNKTSYKECWKDLL